MVLVYETLNHLLQNAGGCCQVPGRRGPSLGSCPPQYRQQMPRLSAGHLQSRRRQRLLELRHRTRSCVANVPGEPEWVHGRRRRAGIGNSEPAVSPGPCSDTGSARAAALPGPEGAAGSQHLLFRCPFRIQAGELSPAQRLVSPYSRAVSHLGDDHGIKLI